MDALPRRPVDIEPLTTPEHIAHWRASFIGAYQTIFSQAPYFERYYPSEAEGMYRRLTSAKDGCVMVASSRGSTLVGFVAGTPLKQRPAVAQTLAGLLDVQRTYYIAELGVRRPFRSGGVGGRLMRRMLDAIPRDPYTHVVIRVSAGTPEMRSFCESFGFRDTGVQMNVAAMRTNTRVTQDIRTLLARSLSSDG